MVKEIIFQTYFLDLCYLVVCQILSQKLIKTLAQSILVVLLREKASLIKKTRHFLT